MRLYAATIFVSAFLLFQVQPIITKKILPWFGGSAAVWTICLLFFQVALLLGYLYAHCSIRYLTPKKQKIVHIALLLISLIALPITPKEYLKPTGSEDPTFKILILLFMTVGLPYFLVSSTGPLLQAWFFYRRAGGRRSGRLIYPYRLYALSNLGSMLALVSYPVLVEPYLTTQQQAIIWSVGYGLFAILCGSVAWRIGSSAKPALEVAVDSEKTNDLTPALIESEQFIHPAEVTGQHVSRLADSGVSHETDLIQTSVANGAIQEDSIADPTYSTNDTPARIDNKPGWWLYSLWIGLAACSSMLLVSITTHLSQNIAAIPFLWVLPLSLYLLSFILCFADKTWVWKRAFMPFPAIIIGAMAYQLSRPDQNFEIGQLIPLFAAGLFICCVFCHGELSRLKPSPRYLTSFYLMLSLGGALGGVFVGVIAPRIFSGYYELPLGLSLCALFALFLLYAEKNIHENWKNISWLVMLIGVSAVIGSFLHTAKAAKDASHLLARNFYGVLQVSDQNDGVATRSLYYGTIKHGMQFLDPARSMETVSYYSKGSGAWDAIHAKQPDGPMRVGVIGLGTGTLAAYGRAGDYYKFYEINPLVIQIARKEFTFLSGTKAKTEIALGDARLTLERELKTGSPQNFDALVVDAFSGDAIPIHLLTKEAMALYFQHLKPDGVLIVHVSNRYLELKPIVELLAEDYGATARLIYQPPDEENYISASEWVLVTRQPELFERPILKKDCEKIVPKKSLRIWTDDYSNLYQILK